MIKYNKHYRLFLDSGVRVNLFIILYYFDLIVGYPKELVMLRSDKRGSLYYVVGKDMLLNLCVNIYIKYYVKNCLMFQVPVVWYPDE